MAVQFFKNLIINCFGLRLDLLARYGSTNAYAIAQGSDGGTELSLSLVSGRNILVHKGHALIGGIVEVSADTTYAVPNSGAGTYWIWLQQSAVPVAVYNSLTPPAGACCLLGSIVDTAGALGTPDTSGVLYLKGGALIRYSADAGGPTDTPATGIQFKHQTAFGTYHYDGSSYKQIGLPQVTADPASPASGDQWFRTDTGDFKVRVGGVTTTIATAGGTGANIYFGTGVPSGGLGVNGDVYFDNAGLNFYKKGGGIWAVVGSTSITANSITNALLAQMPTLTVKGNSTGGTANAADLTVSQVIALLGIGTPVIREVPSGTINSSNVTFTLANTPVVGSENVYLAGLLQTAGGADYSITGATITFVTAPTTGAKLVVSYRK